MRVPIIAGPLKGRWWLLQSHGKVLRIIAGSYEREQTRMLASLVSAGDTVFDVGAHTGYYTVLASLRAGPTGQVRAFEPYPRNARFLERHVRINRCTNTVVEEVAVAERAGTQRFGGGSGSGTGRLADEGAHRVRTVTLDDYCDRHALQPTLVKVDVEGAEAQVLRGAATMLRRYRPVVLLSTHGPSVHAECLALLADMGYDMDAVASRDVASADELICRPRPGGRPTPDLA